MHLPPNGEYDWPNYKAFETCPFCCKRAKPGASDTYWMLFQNLMQKTSDGIGMRFQCRLTCEDCFERFTEGQHLQCSVGGGYLQGVPLLDVVENQGPVTWLRDGQGISAQCTKSQTTLNAYMLYSMWEYCGAWAAMSDQFCDVLKGCRTFSQGIMLRNEPRPDDPDSYWEMSDIPTENRESVMVQVAIMFTGIEQSHEKVKLKVKRLDWNTAPVALRQCIARKNVIRLLGPNIKLYAKKYNE